MCVSTSLLSLSFKDYSIAVPAAWLHFFTISYKLYIPKFLAAQFFCIIFLEFFVVFIQKQPLVFALNVILEISDEVISQKNVKLLVTLTVLFLVVNIRKINKIHIV